MNQRILFLIKFFLFHFILFVGLRAVFFFIFQSNAPEYDIHQLRRALYLGIKFDVRFIFALLAPVYLLSYLPFLNPIQLEIKNIARKFWLFFYSLLYFVWAFIYVVDIGYYGYLQTRINGSIMQFAANPDIALQMVWQTYSVPLILGAIFLFFLVYLTVLRKFIFVEFQYKNLSIGSQLFSHIIFFLLFAVGLYGKVSTFPLRWSEAFFTQNSFVSALALNPVLYLAETYKYQRADFDKEKVKSYYPLMAKYLGVPEKDQDIDKLNFKRITTESPTVLTNPNIIVVVMESMALHKTSFMNNPIDTTPNLKRIAAEGYFNTEYYVPSEGTARSMFTLITGIPDVSTYKTASRNPLIVNQNVIMDQFQGYEKFYFLGGNANWGQIRSVFSHNIDDVHIIEEGHYNKKAIDVWGISDLDLFTETFRILQEKADDKPFFAVIQTAGFHRPYTIPEDRGNFKIETYPDELVRRASFLHNDELNSLRFSDYALGEFFDLLQKSRYADNTILVIVGDHGLPDQNAPHVPFHRRKLSIEKFHVPLVIHNKKLFTTSLIDNKVVTEMDIMPTISALTGMATANTTFGRNIFDTSFDNNRLAFTIDYYSQPHQYGVFDGEFYLLVRGEKEELFNFKEFEESQNLNEKYPEKFEELKNYARGYYETAKYMLYNNPKSLR